MTTPTAEPRDGIAVVTGAASGIGRACSIRLARSCRVVVGVDIDRSALDETCAAITNAGGTAAARVVDVSDADQVSAMAAEVVADHGPPTVLANIVGGAALATTQEMSVDQWNGQVAFNLSSTFLMCHFFLPAMVAAGSGAIVNTSSGWGFMPAVGRSAYAASKAGIVAFSRSLAAEVAPSGVRVNVVAPGPIATERMLALTRDDPVAQGKQASVPLGRLGTPDEVAAVVSFLASAEASYVCGQVVHVNGGVYMP